MAASLPFNTIANLPPKSFVTLSTASFATMHPLEILKKAFGSTSSIIESKDLSTIYIVPSFVTTWLSVEKADSPDYLFVDVDIAKNAASGTCFLVFSKADKEFKYPYVISDRAPGSADRKSFTNADMVYLVFPDRFANGDPTNDSTDDTFEKADATKSSPSASY